MTTRVGESFFQEASQAFRHTNGKDAEHQMSIIDEKHEALAHISMAVEEFDKAREKEKNAPAEHEGAASLEGEHAEPNDDALEPTPQSDELDGPPHWAFGSRKPGAQLNSRRFEDEMVFTSSAFKSFDKRLRALVSAECPKEPALDRDDVLLVSNLISVRPR